jgi:hypothetical protein
MPTRSLILIILLALLSPRAFATSQSFTLSIVPQFTPVDIGMRWAPLLKRLEAETGYGFQLRLLDQARIKEEKDFWMWLNLLVPIGTILLFGIGNRLIRRYRYARRKA